MASSYRTATTAYPCYLPVLGGSAGAGRTNLPMQSYDIIKYLKNDFVKLIGLNTFIQANRNFIYG